MPEYLPNVYLDGYHTVIQEERYKPRRNCRICGDPIFDGSAFYTDGQQTSHMNCLLGQKEDSNE